MSKQTLKAPITPNSNRKEFSCLWYHALYEAVVTADNGNLNLNVEGGSDSGEFAYFGYLEQDKIGYLSGRFEEGDTLLEVQGHKVAGYTQRDVLTLLNHIARTGSAITVKAVRAGYLTKDLRLYLNTRFQKGSLDHDLQNTIRDNLYLRTVPCTTRPAREGEVNGVDYTFLTIEEFQALEKSGNLLESGIYEGNHYGTPKPPKDGYATLPSKSDSCLPILPGAHPSSEGKRRRNRSNVEAMTAKSVDPAESKEASGAGNNASNSRSSTPVTSVNNGPIAEHSQVNVSMDELEPLPPSWEKAYTENGEPYFINHHTNTSQWQDPRLVHSRQSAENTLHELPYGWEKIDDPHYGTYYIDHVNRRTQYESPLVQTKRNMYIPPTTGSQPSPQQQQQQQQQPAEADGSKPSGSQPNSPLTSLPGPARTGRTNSESRLIPSYLPHSQSPRNSPLFTYLPCLPCLNDKHAPNVSPSSNSCDDNNEVVRVEDNNKMTNSPSCPSNHVSLKGGGPRGEEGFLSLPPGNHSQAKLPYLFTRNPSELQGDIVHSSLVKSARGFGFTIVGADDNDSEEFLQIKSIVPNGPAWMDGKLKTGDVLVYVNSICVLGYTHQDVVSLFQSIPPGEMVHLQVCRGYSLPFDPDDPNTEIVTTVAVTSPSSRNPDYQDIYSSNAIHELDDSKARPAKSLPDLSSPTNEVPHPQRHNSADLLNNSSNRNTPDILDFPSPNSQAKFITVEIVKGASGFGFTIADSAYGQKVKKILDEPRCKLLQEGDILVEINGCDVRRHLHTEVVQILKDCVIGDLARITVQRGGFSTPSKVKARSLKGRSPEDIPLKGSNATFSHFAVKPHFSDGYMPPLQGIYRSKTPTAELYSSRDKEIVNVSRPKTPLVDTRNWSSEHSASANDSSRHLNSSPVKPPRTGQYNAPWYFDQPRARDWTSHSFRETRSGAQQGMNRYLKGHADYSSPLYAPKSSISHPNSPVCSLPEEEMLPPSTARKDWSSVSENPFFPNRSWNCSSHDYYFKPEGQVKVPTRNSNFFQSHHGGYYYPSPVSENAPHNFSQGNYHQEGVLNRKHSTSFEHEQPVTSIASRQNSSLAGCENHMDSIELTVTLHRQESGFGFRIVGGTEEGSQVSIGNIVPGGAADLDGRLITGDEIISVDNHSVINASHHHVVQLMGNASLNGCVTLGLRRKVASHDSPHRTNATDVVYPYNVTVSRNENEGFGFVIISSVGKAGSTIGRIIENSPAERCGQLHVGDRILAVNGIGILNMHHGEIVNLIKESGFSVTLTIGQPQGDDTSSTASASQRGEESIPHEPEEQYHSVELHRGTRGFGFSIRGGREFQNMPLFVLRIAEQGPAQHNGKLQVGDQILEINGVSTQNMTHADAINLIRQGGNTVQLFVRRSNKVPSPLVVESPGSQHPGIAGLLNGPLSQSSPRSPGHPPKEWYNWNVDT